MFLKYEIFWDYDQNYLLFSKENSAVLKRHRNDTDTGIFQDLRLHSTLVGKVLAVMVVLRAWSFMGKSSINTEVITNCKAYCSRIPMV